MKLLIHTPVSNRAWVLPEFWAALCAQDLPKGETAVCFDVNDSQDETEALCQSFKGQNGFADVMVRCSDWPRLNLGDHKWTVQRYQRMIALRNSALRLAKSLGCTHLLSIDSDVILREHDTITHLIQAGCSIIAGVFMAKWGNPNAEALPNVWQCGQNEMTGLFLQTVKSQPHHFVVGGLGACTLIGRDVWEAGVTYDAIYNLPSNYRGEDRYFCTRAAAEGFVLTACAHKRIDHLDQNKESEVV